MRDYRWIQTCSDEKIKELEKIAASQAAFRNIPLFQRIVVGTALAIPFFGSVHIMIEIIRRSSQLEQFIVIFGVVIAVAIWALQREATKRQEVLQLLRWEIERRSESESS